MTYGAPRRPSTLLLTFPFAWRATLGRNGALLGSLSRIFEETVQSFYAHRAKREGYGGARTGSVAVLQRSSADLRLNPHIHAVFLDGAWYEQGDELAFAGLGHLRTTEVGEVLECAIRRIGRYLRRRGLLREDPDEGQDAEANLAVSAVSGQTPPAGPQWQVRRPSGLRNAPGGTRRTKGFVTKGRSFHLCA